jgi:hypothetical protein
MDVDFLERRLNVAQQFVRGEITAPKSRAGRRTIPLGPVAADALEDHTALTETAAARCRHVRADEGAPCRRLDDGAVPARGQDRIP